MMMITSTALAYSLAAYFDQFDIHGATAFPAVATRVRSKIHVIRSASGQAGWNTNFPGVKVRETTALSEQVPILEGEDLPNADAVAQLTELLELRAGWDGKAATAPNTVAIRNAVRFLHAVGSLGIQLESAPHTNGSILLEIEDGRLGSLQFTGDSQIAYSLKGFPSATVAFDGVNVPEALKKALSSLNDLQLI